MNKLGNNRNSIGIKSFAVKTAIMSLLSLAPASALENVMHHLHHSRNHRNRVEDYKKFEPVPTTGINAPQNGRFFYADLANEASH